MTNPATSFPTTPHASASAASPGAALESWNDVRDDDDLQFEQIAIPDTPPNEPGLIERALRAFFDWLGEVLAPVGQALAYSWPVLKWVLLGLLVAFIIYVFANSFGPIARRKRDRWAAVGEPDWAPTRSESLALLEDADRLAGEGRYDEATHLLLKRSVGQIAAARPEWVEPSSTARELAALPLLSAKARSAFGAIAERVERSLFALRSLDQSDWEAARSAYSEFALANIGDAA